MVVLTTPVSDSAYGRCSFSVLIVVGECKYFSIVIVPVLLSTESNGRILLLSISRLSFLAFIIALLS